MKSETYLPDFPEIHYMTPHCVPVQWAMEVDLPINKLIITDNPII